MQGKGSSIKAHAWQHGFQFWVDYVAVATKTLTKAKESGKINRRIAEGRRAKVDDTRNGARGRVVEQIACAKIAMSQYGVEVIGVGSV